MGIYLSSGTGVATPGDWDDYNHDALDFVAGMALEQATDRCTWDADRRLDELGIDAEVVHHPVGLHNWSYYSPELPRAWTSIRGPLQEQRGGGRPDTLGRVNPRPALDLTLRLSASAADSRRGIVRAHPEVLLALGMREWDAIEIVGA